MKNGKKQFDLIFMDISMPVMDGLEAASRITDLKVKTPIIALTANIMPHELELYKASGMFDFLSKPFTSQGLWKCLVQYLPVRSYTSISKYRQSAEDEKTKEQLKVLFVKENQTTYTEIKSALGAGDIKLAHRLAHALKNSAGQIDEKQLQSIAARAEAALSDGENLLDRELLSALEAELKSVLNELMPLLEKKEEPKKLIALDAEETLELFKKLEPLLKNRDTKSLQLLDLIRAVPGTEELAYQIEGFNFKQAAEMLESLKRDRNS
jgi:CheY-like chemotaxis protein